MVPRAGIEPARLAALLFSMISQMFLKNVWFIFKVVVTPICDYRSIEKISFLFFGLNWLSSLEMGWGICKENKFLEFTAKGVYTAFTVKQKEFHDEYRY